MTGGTVTCTTATGGINATAYGINITGGTANVTTATGGINATAYGLSVNSAAAIANVTTATGEGSAPGLYVNAGTCNLYEALGNGYGPGGSGGNIASAACSSTGRLGVRKITFGPLGQCPISGNARLVPDAAIPTPFFIPLDADYPAAGSGTNPAFTTATTLAQQVAATVGEILRTQP